MPGDRKDPRSIRHDDVLALPNDAKPSLLESPHRIQVIDAGDLAHSSHSHIDFADLTTRK